MTNMPVDLGRRRFLTLTTAVVGGVGVAFTAVPFIRSWSPSGKARAAGAPVEVDISKLSPGQLIRVEWRGQPVWIVHRPQAVLDNLRTIESQLRDPQSQESQQPDYVQNEYRSRRSDIFISVGICTHLGCSPNYLPGTFSDPVNGVGSGFFCPCHGSRFDMAGRVFQGGAAPLNLVVPPHYYMDDTRVMIGLDEEIS